MKFRVSSEFAVEQGVPIPPVIRCGREWKYPYPILRRGESFFAPGVLATTINKSMQYAQKKLGNGHKFAARTMDGGCRVWRIK